MGFIRGLGASTVASALLACGTPLVAQEDLKADFLACEAIRNDSARLGCFDGLATSLGADAGASQPSGSGSEVSGSTDGPAASVPVVPLQTITREDFESAFDNQVKPQGLILTDTARGVIRAISALDGQEDGIAEGFSVQIFTPVSWVAHILHEAARDYRPLTWEKLRPEDGTPSCSLRTEGPHG